MSVNLYNATTDTLKNIAGDIINPKSVNEMIAPIEDGTASKSYAVGEQFIMNDLLCEATQAIAQGDTMVIGTNCEESEQLSKQVKDIKSDLTELRRKVGMPTLDYANPLHTFSSGNLTYTATKECYLMGGFFSSDSSRIKISINNVQINDNPASGYAYSSEFIPLMKLSIGDTVSVSGGATPNLHIYEEIS